MLSVPSRTFFVKTYLVPSRIRNRFKLVRWCTIERGAFLVHNIPQVSWPAFLGPLQKYLAKQQQGWFQNTWCRILGDLEWLRHQSKATLHGNNVAVHGNWPHSDSKCLLVPIIGLSIWQLAFLIWASHLATFWSVMTLFANPWLSAESAPIAPGLFSGISSQGTRRALQSLPFASWPYPTCEVWEMLRWTFWIVKGKRPNNDMS